MAIVFRLFVFAFPFAGAAWIYPSTKFPLFVYAIVSALTFLFYGIDKLVAVKNRGSADTLSRIPEKVLHLLEFFGGFPGALCGQILFRHKSSKKSYQIVFWLIVSFHFSAWIYFLFFFRAGKI